ncbi:MAG: restriction endonuclease [Clostridia bacterium]|nr:restriction endonuclease [Clostridia bacterium]
MNIWTRKSVELAARENYLDALYEIYPISPNSRRELSSEIQRNIEDAFISRDNERLVKNLLEAELFPIKDSYVAYLRKDPSAITRNPQMINRIAETIYAMGYDAVIEKCTEPKESNRQIGPMFKNWLNRGTLGVNVYRNVRDFLRNPDENAVLNVSDAEAADFAVRYLGYNREKGLDFLARFNNKYVVGEAKFLTDSGGHQNAQFDDAVSTITAPFRSNVLNAAVIPVAIMDGVLYIRGNTKMYRYLEKHDEQIIFSGLLLREFLYSL